MSTPEFASASDRLDGCPHDDRRAWVRYPGRLGAFHLLDDDDEPRCWAQIREASRGGISVWLRGPVAVGARLIIEVPEKPGKPPLPVLMRVVHATAAKGGRWLIGCEFVQPLGDNELQALRAGPPPHEGGATPASA